MSRASLCLALAALTACATAGQARAHGHRHHVDEHIYRDCSFFGFLDYRHAVGERHDEYSRELDARREYVFHRLAPGEAYDLWYGGHDRGPHKAIRTIRWGNGPHHGSWNVHASDHHED